MNNEQALLEVVKAARRAREIINAVYVRMGMAEAGRLENLKFIDEPLANLDRLNP